MPENLEVLPHIGEMWCNFHLSKKTLFVDKGWSLSFAIKKFWDLQDNQNKSSDEAAAEVWKTYPRIHLVPYSNWTPTRGNPTSRRGPIPPPHKMTKKRGPKPKMDVKRTAAAKQKLLRHPKASNTALAQQMKRCQILLFFFLHFSTFFSLWVQKHLRKREKELQPKPHQTKENDENLIRLHRRIFQDLSTSG